MNKIVYFFLLILVMSGEACTGGKPIFSPEIPEDVEIPSNADPNVAHKHEHLDSTIVTIEKPGRKDSIILSTRLFLIERGSFRDGYGVLYSTYSTDRKYGKKFALPEEHFTMKTDGVLYDWLDWPVGELRLEFDCPCSRGLGEKLEFWDDSLATRLPIKLLMDQPKLIDDYNGKFPIPGISTYALDTLVSPKNDNAFLLAPVVLGNRVCKLFELERHDRYMQNGVKETFYQPHFTDYRHLDKVKGKMGEEYYTVDGVRVEYFVIVTEVPIVVTGMVYKKHKKHVRKHVKKREILF